MDTEDTDLLEAFEAKELAAELSRNVPEVASSVLELLEVLGHTPFVLLVGLPGSGKTSLLAAMSAHLAGEILYLDEGACLADQVELGRRVATMTSIARLSNRVSVLVQSLPVTSSHDPLWIYNDYSCPLRHWYAIAETIVLLHREIGENCTCEWHIIKNLRGPAQQRGKFYLSELRSDPRYDTRPILDRSADRPCNTYLVPQSQAPAPQRTFTHAIRVASARAAQAIGAQFLLGYRGGQFYEPAQNVPPGYVPYIPGYAPLVE